MTLQSCTVKKLSDKAKIPKQATPGSIGLDLFAPVEYPIPPNEQVLIPTDLTLFLQMDTFSE